MYFFKTPSIIKRIFSKFVWNIPTNDKVIYLTFDDGPMPDITDWVLEVLGEYNAKATFFCVGENVKKYPEVYGKIIASGHKVGNHTYTHINGWKNTSADYVANVEKASEYIDSGLFRPPYGKIKSKQSAHLLKHYTIVMWDVLSGDFDKAMTYKKCLEELKKNTKAGSIVVFHDSIKSEHLLRQVLPTIIEHWTYEGYRFESLAHLDQQKHSQTNNIASTSSLSES